MIELRVKDSTRDISTSTWKVIKVIAKVNKGVMDTSYVTNLRNQKLRFNSRESSHQLKYDFIPRRNKATTRLLSYFIQ